MKWKILIFKQYVFIRSWQVKEKYPIRICRQCSSPRACRPHSFVYWNISLPAQKLKGWGTQRIKKKLWSSKYAFDFKIAIRKGPLSLTLPTLRQTILCLIYSIYIITSNGYRILITIFFFESCTFHPMDIEYWWPASYISPRNCKEPCSFSVLATLPSWLFKCDSKSQWY